MTDHNAPHVLQHRCNDRLRALRRGIGTKIHSLRRHHDMTLHIVMLAQALGVPEDYFLSGESAIPSTVARPDGSRDAATAHPADRDP